MYNSWTKINASGGTYIVMAFADSPIVNSNGVPCNARQNMTKRLINSLINIIKNKIKGK